MLFCVEVNAGSIILTGRANDPSPAVGTGTNFCVENNNSPRTSDFASQACNSGLAQQGGQSSGLSKASGGIVMSSSAQGGPFAGFSYASTGKVSVLAPSITILNGSSTSVNPLSAWQSTFAFLWDGSLFDDPMRGKGQPPITTSNLGNPAIPGTTASNGFPVLKLGPGRYTFAGTLPNPAFASGVSPSLTIEPGATLQDVTPVGATSASNAGEILIFTDLNYPGLSTNIPAAVQSCACLSYGTSGIFMPDPNNNLSSTTTIVLHGLSPNNGIPPELATFGSVVFWQDQGNLLVKYTSSGFVDTTSCGAGFTLDNPCPNALAHPNAA
jgi:hypothetical protein